MINIIPQTKLKVFALEEFKYMEQVVDHNSGKEPKFYRPLLQMLSQSKLKEFRLKNCKSLGEDFLQNLLITLVCCPIENLKITNCLGFEKNYQNNSYTHKTLDGSNFIQELIPILPKTCLRSLQFVASISNDLIQKFFNTDHVTSQLKDIAIGCFNDGGNNVCVISALSPNKVIFKKVGSNYPNQTFKTSDFINQLPYKPEVKYENINY